MPKRWTAASCRRNPTWKLTTEPLGSDRRVEHCFRPVAGSVYEQDVFLWAKEQAHLLEERRFGELDLENLIEEVRTVGGSDKREIYSRMEVLIVHLLKWRHRPGRRTPSWQTTIRHQRTRIGKIVGDSPSLRRYPASELSDAYVGGRLRAADETGIDFTLFPADCPFTIDQVLDPVFMPDSADQSRVTHPLRNIA